ncbi:MAG: hypothetical protein RLZZ420_147 [Bacteroidota bacterium]|jgi:hypothetical protein
MGKTNFKNTIFIKSILWGAILFSTIALIYHVRWFIPFLTNKISYVVPNGQLPLIWFLVQICNNLIFLFVAYLLIKIFHKFQKTGYFDQECILVLDRIIFSCIGLAILGVIKLGFSDYNDIQVSEIKEVSELYLFIRFFTNILVLKEPQTMYLLIASILWTVKQFVNNAIFVKRENEKFI